MLTKEEYVLGRIKGFATHKARENEIIKPLSLVHLIEQLEFDYDMDKEYYPENLKRG